MAESTGIAAVPGVVIRGNRDRWTLSGALDVRTLAAAKRSFPQSSGAKQQKSRTLDLRDLETLDTPGALLLCDWRDKGVQLIGVQPRHQALLDLVCGLGRGTLPAEREVPQWREAIVKLGQGADDAYHDAYEIVVFIGKAITALGRALFRRGYLRPAAISRHIEEAGVLALPIVGLMAIAISVVIGYQGVTQLRPYGADDFTINLVAVSVLREMGVLITAILVAGRSGSAFTAEIGVMKAREEIDALLVMGIDPMQVLVAPRLIALLVALPLLTFFADMAGILGGAIVCHSLLGISPAQYVQRVHQAVDASDAVVGLLKAPVFAFMIAVIGCMHGLRVRGSADSVGRETTRAVVIGIFLVIVLDGLFSILFEKVGL